jgi:regulatory protein
MSIALPLEELGALGVEPGAVVDLDALVARAAEVQSRAAMEDAARYLGMAERSTEALAKYLARRGYLPGTVENAVKRSVELGLVDDARFAGIYARSRPGLGRSALRRRLAGRGVPTSAAAAALRGRSDSDALESLLPLLRRKYSSLPSDTATRRALAFLERRGIPAGLAWPAVRRLFGGSAGAEGTSPEEDGA